MFAWGEENDLPFAIAGTLGCAYLISRELSPNTRLNYSKFTNPKSGGVTVSEVEVDMWSETHTKIKLHVIMQVPSQYGMLVIYGPSMLIGAYFLLNAFRASESTRLLLIAFTSFAHYFKRVFVNIKLSEYRPKKKSLIFNFTYIGSDARPSIFRCIQAVG